MIFCLAAFCALGAASGASNLASQAIRFEDGDPKWTQRSGPIEACKDKEEGDRCSFSPFGHYKEIFSYTHDQQLDKSITEALQERGLAEKQWFPLLRIANQNGKPLDKNFL